MAFLCRSVALRMGVGLMLVLLTGCPAQNPHGDPNQIDDSALITPTPGTVTLTGEVKLGADGPPPDQLTVLNSVHRATPRQNGSYTLKALPGGAQCAVVLGPGGEPMLLGFVDETHGELSAYSTAEVLAYFALACYLLPLEAQPGAIEALRGAPELEALANAIATSLAADPGSLIRDNPAVHAELEAAVAAFRAKSGTAKQRLRSMMRIDPSERRSGIDVLHAPSVNTIQIVNSYRRRGFVYIDQRAYIPADSDLEVSEVRPHTETEFELKSVQGVGGGIFDTASDIFNGIFNAGAMAYEPVGTAPIGLPLRSGAKRTTYRVTIVGAGATGGDTNLLSTAQRNQMYITWATTAGLDVLLPAFVNIVLPIQNYGGFHDIISPPNSASLYEDFINGVKDTPGFLQAMEAGETGQAFSILWKHLAYDNSTLRSLVVWASGIALSLLDDAGMIPGNALVEYVDALEHVGKILNAMKVVDIIFAAGDVGAVIVHAGKSHQADVWTIDVLKPKVTLDPAQAEIDRFAHLKLTARVPELTGFAPGTVQLEYRWQHTGEAGSVVGARGQQSNDFMSSDDWLQFVADGEQPGTDTIKVTVWQINVGGSSTVKEELGSATAPITVLGTGVSLTPESAELDPTDVVELKAQIHPEPDPGDEIEYEWACAAAHGAIVSGGGVHDATATYRAGFFEMGTETVDVKAFRSVDGERKLLGSHTATLHTASADLNLAPPLATIELGDDLPVTATLAPLPEAADGTLSYHWTNTATVGTLTGAAGEDDFVSDNNVATYAANDTEPGTDTVVCQARLTKGAQTRVIATDGLQISVELASTWPRTYGGSLYDTLYGLVASGDGGYLLLAETYSNDHDVTGHHGASNRSDLWAVKLAADGTIIWQRSLGGSATEGAAGICPDGAGGCVVAGRTYSTDGDSTCAGGDGYGWLVHLNASGGIEERVCAGTAGSYFEGIARTPDGHYVALMRDSPNCIAWKFNTALESVWSTPITGAVPAQICAASDNGCALAGSYIRPGAEDTDFIVIKLKADGTEDWRTPLTGSRQDGAEDIALLPDGGFLVGGMITSPDGDWASNSTVAYAGGAARLAATGGKLWAQAYRYPGASLHYIRTVASTSDNGGIVMFAGVPSTARSGSHNWIVKLGPTGGQEWSTVCGGNSWMSYAYAVERPAGGYLVGVSQNHDLPNAYGATDIHVVSLTSAGAE